VSDGVHSVTSHDRTIRDDSCHEPFGNTILRRASEAARFLLDAEAVFIIDYVAIEIRGPIKD
jgi:hypothetical protein